MRGTLESRCEIPDAFGEDIAATLIAAFTHTNPEREAKRAMGFRFWFRIPATLTTATRKDGVLSFPRGGMDKVLGILADHGIALAVDDKRSLGRGKKLPAHTVQLRPYQEDAVEAILDRETCLLRSGTGSGKTTIALAAAARSGVATLVIVPNRALHEQWVERARKELGLARSQVGEIRGGNYVLLPLTIGVQRSVAIHAKKGELQSYFGMVIADEASLFGATTFFECIDPFPSKYRIGVSADHRRKDRKEYLIHDLFGDVAMEISSAALIADGHLVDVEIRMLPTQFDAPWYGVGGGKEVDFTGLVQAMADDEARNQIVINSVKAMHEERGQLLVLAHTRNHCAMLAERFRDEGLTSVLLLGGDAAAFASGIDDIRSGRAMVGVGTYKAIGLGLDLPAVGGVVAATPIAANEQMFGQVRGRVCRPSPGKKDAVMVYLWDRNVFGRKHLENVSRWNANTFVYEYGELTPAKQALGKKGNR